jgi:hypothetical protein
MNDKIATSQAIKLFKALEKDRKAAGILGKPLKDYQTTGVILQTDPAVQIAFVQHITAIFTGMANEKSPNAHYWWGDLNHPWTSAKMAELLIKKRIPITDDVLVDIFEKYCKAALLTTSVLPCLEALVAEVEKRSKERPLSKKLGRVIRRVADGLIGRKLSRTAKRIWREEEHTPDASDRKLAGRIERMLIQPLQLG